MKELSSLTDFNDDEELHLNYLTESPKSTKGLVHLHKAYESFGSMKSLPRKNTSKEIQNVPSLDSDEEEYGWNQNHLELGIQWFTLLTDNLLSHPFFVLQRQCQVNNESQKFHLNPMSLIPSVINLHRGQKFNTLWKGLGSCLLVRGLTVAMEDLIYNLLSWPKVVHSRTSLKSFGEHILLKCVSIAAVTPFLSASLVETVQSDIASEKPSIFDVFREGVHRLSYWTTPKRGRIIPIWILIGPSIIIGLGKHISGLMIKGIFARLRKFQTKIAEQRKKSMHVQNFEMYSNLFSVMFSNVIFYPFETILYRLQLQGTRTIIDNLDNGCSVVPILTSYRGVIDCYKTTISAEGIWGLYKGFGAVILHFLAQIAIIKISKWSGTQIANMATQTLSCEQANEGLLSMRTETHTNGRGEHDFEEM